MGTKDLDLALALGLFFGAAAVVIVAASRLAASGDVIAARTGWGQVWVGGLLLAGATSLPELVTSSTAALLDKPDLAASNIFGSNAFNIAALALLVPFFGGIYAYQRILRQQLWLAGLALGLTALAVLLATVKLDVKWGIVSPASLILLFFFVGGSRMLFRRGSSSPTPEDKIPAHSMRWGWTVFGLSAVAIFAAAPFLASSAGEIATITGMSQGFIGALALAFVTSLPEIATSIAAMRIGAINLAVSNIYGSNALNIAALAVADLFFNDGSLFGNLDNSAIIAGLFAIVLTVLGLWQIMARKPLRHLSFTGPSTAVIVGLWGLGLYFVFATG